MKNLKIGVKLVGGFILTALIIMAVGITAIVEQGKMQHLQEELADDNLPAVQNLLIIKSEAAAIASLMRTILTPYISVEQRKLSHQGLGERRKIYGAAKTAFLALDFAEAVKPQFDIFSKHISKWVTVNNKAVEISQNLIDTDMTNPIRLNNHMNDFEIAHQSLLAKVGKLVAFKIDFEGGNDGTACSLGKWLGNMDTTNPQIVALAKDLQPIHMQLHQHVGKIKDLIAESRGFEARDITINELFPLSERVFKLVYDMKAVSDIANASFLEMNTLLLEEASVHQENTFKALDVLVEKAKTEAAATVKRGESIAKTSQLITIVGICLGVLLALILGFYLTHIITKPLQKGVELSKAMAGGDMTQTMDVDQKDEIGILAQSLNEMAKNLRKMITDVSVGVESVDDSSSQLAAISNQMQSGAENTASRSGQVASAAEEMSANQNTVAAAMEQASVNVNMVATATEEMNATISEIAQNSHNAKEITTQAVGKSKKAAQRVDELGRAADEINKVTEAITEISEQTNLLALNATIEAARAGEAGKGFAVVANEIKDLAKQTAQATLDIKTKIYGIQQATGITVTEINDIQTVISDIDQIVSTIAAAIEEQTATTREIAENVSQASTGITEVNENVAQSSTVAGEIASDIAEVNNSANEMNQASSRVKESASDLSGIAINLKNMIAKFTV
ncbi:MAG: methyl-accepting chemotaxis protein [Desulforhopalus sp.]|jgi:methyl-accepting chemotaxis protein